MKTRPFLVALLLALFFLFSGVSKAYDFSYTYQGKTLYYTYTDSGVKVVAPGDTNYVTGHVVIPSWITFSDGELAITAIVSAIGDNAFSTCSGLTSIEIPYGITQIGASAFEGCTSLTSIEIPSEITQIGASAFEGCTSLTSIEIPSSVNGIGNWVFYNCSSLTSVTIPNSVTSIGNYAFSGCSSLTSITIPSSVTFIGNNAFSNCSSLDTITINSDYVCKNFWGDNATPTILKIGGLY